MPEDAADTNVKSKKRSRMTMTLALVGGVAIVEGIGFYAVTKMFGGGPQVVHGAEGSEGNLLDGEEPGEIPLSVEVELLKGFRVPNERKGRLYIYDFDVTVKVPGRRQEEAAKLVEGRRGEISDHVARIVRAADPATLQEPDLKTLRLKLQHTIGEVFGDQDIIIEILIPRCVPIRSD
jgi:hypothetical protein